MLKSLILFILATNICLGARLSEEHKKKFFESVDQQIAELKTENKGKVDLQLMKTGLYQELEENVQQQILTREEATKIKQNYETLLKSNVSPNDAEKAFKDFIQKEFGDVNNKPVPKIKEGNVCNTWSCEDGLKCAPDPLQMSAQTKLKKSGEECSDASECASNECTVESVKSKKKICEDVYRCYRPLKLGEACLENPVCGSGSCLPFSYLTSGVGECSSVGLACKKNSDCCSNSCDRGQCKDNFVCKDCIPNGSKPSRGQKCCEGLYLNGAGICAPDVPPTVINEVYVPRAQSFLVAVVDFLFSSANAGEISKVQTQFDQITKVFDDANPGTTVPWGNGKLTLLPNGNIKYLGSNGTSVELTDKTNIIKAANANADIRQNVIQTYGLDPLGLDRDQQATNAKNFDNFAKIEAARPAGQTSTSVEVPGMGKVTYTFSRTEGSGDNQTTYPATITTPYGTVFNPASEFYSSNEYAAMVGKKMTDEDYAFLAEAKANADKPKTNKTAETEASALEDEEEFLNAGGENDGLDVKSAVNKNAEKSIALVGQGVARTGKNVDLGKNAVKLTFDKKSNFNTCEIRFKDDFYNTMKGNGTFDLEVALLAFDWVTTGDSDSDYWKQGDDSIITRLKKIGQAHREKRKEVNTQIDLIQKKITCACLDVQGYNKIVNNEKKKFFETQCEEYAKYTNPETSLDELNGDASGLKAKRLLVTWTSNLTNFYQSLTIDNNATFNAIAAVKNFTNPDGGYSSNSNSAKWNEAVEKKYDLFKFSIKNPSGSVAGLGAIIGALLAAGIIAVLGGFATTSLLSTWAAAGIITASAVTGAGGLWMLATLKGAWTTMSPKITDYNTAPRTYSCGKKESCTEYTRTLVQPYNNVCGKHTSANACIKAFIITNEGKEARYIVDPWIPVGIERAYVLKNQPNYVEKLEEGFNSAKNAMLMKNPMATGGGGKKGGGEYVSEMYLAEVFIDGSVVGQYTPKIGIGMQENYFFGQDRVKVMKEAAKKFAIAENYLEKGDEANLQAFADYAYTYHFLWPKTSHPGMIAYPTIGLTTYLDYMANGVAGNVSVGMANTVKTLAKLNEKYLKDYRDTLGLYDTTLNKTDGLKKSLLSAEIAKTDQALASLINFNALLDSKDLDAKLSGLNAGSNGTSSLSGANGGLSSDQTNFLKAVSNLRNARKNQLKSLATYNKAMASNGDKDRAAKMTSAGKKFSQQFATGHSAFGSGFGSGSASSGSSSGKDGSDADAKKYGAGSGYGSGTSGQDGLNGTGALFGSGSGSGSGSSNKNADANGAGAGNGSGVNDADANKLSDAIDARNKSNKDKYQSNDGQTLFEKVTNAYIRNYDKVLSKKKDKDVVEDKE